MEGADAFTPVHIPSSMIHSSLWKPWPMEIDDKHYDLPIKHDDLPIKKQGNLPIKKLVVFPIQNGDFAFKHGDFPIFSPWKLVISPSKMVISGRVASRRSGHRHGRDPRWAAQWRDAREVVPGKKHVVKLRWDGWTDETIGGLLPSG